MEAGQLCRIVVVEGPQAKVDAEETAANRELTVTLDAVVPAGPKIQ